MLRSRSVRDVACPSGWCCWCSGSPSGGGGPRTHQSLGFLSRAGTARPALSTPPYGETQLTPADLMDVDAVVSGRSSSPYHTGLVQEQVDSVVRGSGFTLVRSWQLSATNVVELWQRG